MIMKSNTLSVLYIYSSKASSNHKLVFEVTHYWQIAEQGVLSPVSVPLLGVIV